jgi:hypothetical protein
MVELIPPPDPHTLLPPLLACLPTAFVSIRPPPVLLPLLSPILRQRVQILSSVSTSPTDSWLRLLCWDSGKAERLQALVDGTSFETHPVSGEIELPGEVHVGYKRVDEETLHSRILLPEYSLKAVYLWCSSDQDGGGPGWRLAELMPHEGGAESDGVWSFSIGEANAQAKEQLLEDALREAEQAEKVAPHIQERDDEEDDDAGYWAQYDATPGRTPSVKTPAPNPLSSLQLQRQDMSEASYFSRYADVQPAMDNHDPAEEQPQLGPTSLNGDMLAGLLRQQIDGSSLKEPARANGYANGTIDETTAMSLDHPRPSSASSTGSEAAVAKLEQEAENQSACEVGVKQHISTNIKSLFRLAKITGISRAEFQSIVKTELELLSLSDDDE